MKTIKEKFLNAVLGTDPAMRAANIDDLKWCAVGLGILIMLGVFCQLTH